MDVLVFLIVVALIWLLVWLIYRIILTKVKMPNFNGSDYVYGCPCMNGICYGDTFLQMNPLILMACR